MAELACRARKYDSGDDLLFLGSLSTRRYAVNYLLGRGTVTVQLTFGFTPM
jgi:hypothetical protein